MIRKNYFLFIFHWVSLSPIILFSQTATLKTTLTLIPKEGIYVPYQNGIPLPSFEKQKRQTINLNGVWKKQRFIANHDISLAERDTIGYNNLINEAQERYLANYDDNSWDNKIIPGVENIMYAFPKVPEYYQDGIWYRFKFNAPDSIKSKFIKLIFYSVNYVADVWLNDHYLGYHEGGYTPFAFDVSNKIIFNGQNVLAVRVDNPAWGKRKDIVPYSEVDWFNYAGIIQDVYLEVSDPISFIRADVIPKDVDGNIQTIISVLNKSGSLKDVTANVEIYKAGITTNNITSERAYDLIDEPANFSGTSQSNIEIQNDSLAILKLDLRIENPNLWSPKNPNLYILRITLNENGKLLDEFCTQFGIRILNTAGNKVLLNNKVVFLTGVARHEDHPLYGRSIPLDTIFSDLEKVKGLNANYLRTAHYPNHLYTYIIADRLGIAIMEEIPVWQFDLEEAWLIQNNQRHLHEQMFKEMIFKDFNRPSILMWSTCNECKDVDNRKIFIQKIQAEMKDKIKDGRFITQSAAADRPGPDDASQIDCDIAGWTLYFGIFYGTSYSGGTNNFLINAKVKNPGKPVIDTEFGYWSSEDNSTTDKQAKVFNETFNSFKNFATITSSGFFNPTGFLMGTTWWCIFDWYSHGHPYGYQSMGLYSMDRKKLKPVGQSLKDAYAPYYNLGGLVTDVENKDASNVKDFELDQNFPNPFNPTTTIKYSVPTLPTGQASSSVSSPLVKGRTKEGFVTLKVYDILGNEITTLVNEEKRPGIYNIEFNGERLSSGIYFYSMFSGNKTITRKMLLLK